MPGKREGLRTTPGGGGQATARRRPRTGDTPDLFAEVEGTGRAEEGRTPRRRPGTARPAEGGGPRGHARSPGEGRADPSAGSPFDPWGALFAEPREEEPEGVSTPARPRPADAKKTPAKRR